MAVVRGEIGGIPVVFHRNEGQASVGYAEDEAPFSENPGSQWTGPAGITKRVTALFFDGDAEKRAKALYRMARVEPFLPLYDPQGFFFDETDAWVRIQNIREKRSLGLVELEFDLVYLGNQWTHSLAIVATAKQRTNVWSLPGVTALHVPAAGPRLIGDWRCDETAGNLGAELVTNGDFENYPASPGAPPSWVIYEGAAADFTKETMAVDGGTSALKMQQVSGAANLRAYTNVSLVSGRSYLFRVRIRRPVLSVGTVIRPRIRDSAGTLLVDAPVLINNGTTSYETYLFTWTATSTGTFRFALDLAPSNADAVWFDNASVREIVIRDYSGYGHDMVVGAQGSATNLPGNFVGPTPGIAIPGITGRTGWRFAGNDGTSKQGAQALLAGNDAKKTGLHDLRSADLTMEVCCYRNGLQAGAGGYIFGKLASTGWAPRFLLEAATVSAAARNPAASPADVVAASPAFATGETARFLMTFSKAEKIVRVYKRSLYPNIGAAAFIGQVAADDWHSPADALAWCIGGPVSSSIYASAAVDVAYARAWAGAMTNDQALAYLEDEALPTHLPGIATALGETVDDTTRSVIETPAAFAAHDAAYIVGATARNATAPIEVIVNAAPRRMVDSWVRCYDALGSPIAGSGVPLRDGSFLENCAIRLTVGPNKDTISVQDLRLGLGSADVVLSPHDAVVFTGAGLPSTGLRRLLSTDAGQRIEFYENGNWVLDPAGLSFRIPQAATRSLGSGVFYHAVRTNVYLVGSQDFSIASDGTVTYNAGAIFSLVFSTLAGAPLNARLQEVFMETLTTWMLRPRSR
jgi:hypothetical protein